MYDSERKNSEEVTMKATETDEQQFSVKLYRGKPDSSDTPVELYNDVCADETAKIKFTQEIIKVISETINLNLKK